MNMNNIIVNITNNVNSILSIVGKATLDSPEPTSGYLLLELQNETFKSIEKCEEILKKLLERLKKDSSHVKLKSLKCIKHLMLKGNPVFKQELILNSNEIHKCTSFSGKQDAIYGDNPYMLVRQEAQDILNMLYQYSNNDNSNSNNNPFSNNNNNSGNNNELALYEGYGNSIVVVSQQPKVMVGVGSNGAITNAPIQQLTPIDEIKKDIKEKIQSLPSKVFNTEQSKLSFESIPNTDPNQFSLVPLKDGSHFINYNGNSSINSNSNNIGGSGLEIDPNNPYLGTDEYINISAFIGNDNSSTLSTSSMSKFFSYYKQLSTLESIENVLSILYYSIESFKKWQTKQKYLCLIEFLIIQKIDTAVQFFKSNNTNLINLSNSIHLGPREKSKSILRLLNIDFEKDLQSIQEQQKRQKELLEKQMNSNQNITNNSNSNSNNNQNNNSNNSLFSFDDDQPTTTSPSVTSPNQNLFGGLNLKSNVKSNNTNSNNSSLINNFDFFETNSNNNNIDITNNSNNNKNNNNASSNNNTRNNSNNSNNNNHNNSNNNYSNTIKNNTNSNNFDPLDPLSNKKVSSQSSIMDDFDFSTLSFSNSNNNNSPNTLKPLSQSTPVTPTLSSPILPLSSSKVSNSSVNSSPLLNSNSNNNTNNNNLTNNSSSNNKNINNSGLNDFDFYVSTNNNNSKNNTNNINSKSNNSKNNNNSSSPFSVLDSYI